MNYLKVLTLGFPGNRCFSGETSGVGEKKEAAGFSPRHISLSLPFPGAQPEGCGSIVIPVSRALVIGNLYQKVNGFFYGVRNLIEVNHKIKV
jgi:hypothetical protein